MGDRRAALPCPNKAEVAPLAALIAVGREGMTRPGFFFRDSSTFDCTLVAVGCQDGGCFTGWSRTFCRIMASISFRLSASVPVLLELLSWSKDCSYKVGVGRCLTSGTGLVCVRKECRVSAIQLVPNVLCFVVTHL